jgi:hypothetical protein
MRGWLIGLLAVVALAASLWCPAVNAGSEDGAIRLVMVEETGCRFCARWNAEIGGAYEASAEGRFAPLNRVKRAAPELEGLRPIVFTPTFILMRGTVEVGRITGYPGKDFFWDELAPLLAGAGFTAEPVKRGDAGGTRSRSVGIAAAGLAKSAH